MLSALQGLKGLYITVIFTLVLNFTVSADVGCEDWSLSGENDVCCSKCKPGNRLVKRCGRDKTKLCTPCEPGTYITNLDYRCHRCTQCIGVQFTLKNCTSSSDAICGCKAGFRCGDGKCSFCVKECKKGEEPTERTCTECPEGKFNDRIHSMCKDCTKSCPNGLTLKKGNSTCDNMCIKAHNEQDTQYVKGANREQKHWLPVMIAAGMAGFAFLCIVVSVIAYVKTKRQKENEPKIDASEKDVLTESGIMVVTQEDCSFRHPEQEQGGSSDSINTESSESKLIL